MNQTPSKEEKTRKSPGLIIIWIIVVLVAGGIVLYFVFSRGFTGDKDNSNTSVSDEISDEGVIDSAEREFNSAVEKITGRDPEEYKDVFFVHHSTGEIYWEGGMQEVLAAAGYQSYAPWWDGETDPEDFYNEFSDSDKWNIITGESLPPGEERDILIFKSCFPASDITSDQMLEDYKDYYRELYPIYSTHPDMLFVPMSTPPLLKASTSADAALRSLEFEDWLTNEYVDDYQNYLGSEGLEGIDNLAPFALHSLLSDDRGFLAADFIADPSDDHPNYYSGEVVGEAIVEHLNNSL